MGLKARAITFCILIVLGAVGTISAVLIRQNYADSIRRVTQHAVSQARSMSLSAAPAVMLDDKEEIRRILHAAASDDALMLACMRGGTQDKPLRVEYEALEDFSSELEPPEDAPNPMGGPFKRGDVRVEHSRDELVVVVPVWSDVTEIDLSLAEEAEVRPPQAVDGADAIGFVCLIYSFKQVDAELTIRVLSSVGIACVVIAIGIGLTIVMMRKLLRPVQDLVTTTSIIAEGNLAERTSSHAVGEIGVLARSFNNMADRLQESYASIERKVEERTAELEARRRELQVEVAERRRAEEELLSEKQFSDTTIDSTPGVFYLFDDQGKFLRWNNELERTSGYTADELAGMHPLQFISDADKDRVQKAIAEVFTSGESSVEAGWMSKDGRVDQRYFTGKRITRDGKHYLVGVGIDITDRRVAEEALRSSERRLRHQNICLVDLARDDEIHSGDLAAALRRITKVAAQTVHVERASVWLFNEIRSGMRCWDLYERTSDRHSEGVELMMADYPAYFQALQEGRAIAAHDAHTDPRTKEFSSGYLTPVGITSMLDAPIRASGRIAGAVCFEHVGEPRVWAPDEENFAGSIADLVTLAMDAAERNQAELEIERLSHQNQMILDSAGEGIYGLGLDGRTTFVNPAGARMLGWTVDELAGQLQHDILHHSKADGTPYPREECPIYAALKDGGVHHMDSDVFWRKDGTSFPVEYVSTPIHESGKLTGAVVVFRDITERKQVQEETEWARLAAEAANRAKSEFLANMSHEIRTPMNGIMGMTELVLGTDLTDEQREYLGTVSDCSNSLLTLLNDILDFSKIEAGKLRLESIDFDTVPNVENVAGLLAHRATEKNLELICTISPEVPPRLRGDPARLRQVLVNLVGNAIKFTEQGEVVMSVEVESRRDENVTLLFSVCDTGVGIPADRLDRIFRSFTQADGTITRKYGGTGLGLSVSKQIIELMEGDIWVDSEVDQGSTFSFRVTLELTGDAGGARETQDAHTSAARRVLRDRRILVVDDNATNRRILCQMLEPWGCSSESAVGGTDALTMLRLANAEENPFDLVILDVQMPETDGFQVGAAIRADSSCGDPLIVFLSSLGNGGAEEGEGAVANTVHLTKPIRQAVLLDALIGALTGIQKSQECGAAPTGPVVERRRHRARILLVEDNPINRTVVIRILEKCNHDVTTAEDGLRALALLEQQSFDLVLMDVQMPQMDGLEATRRIRADSRFCGLPIVAMTAHAMKGDRDRCLDMGMDDYLTKPVSALELERMIEKWAADSRKPAKVVESNALESDFRGDGESVPETPVDIQKALDQLGGDRELFDEVFAAFLDNMPKILAELQSAVNAGDAWQVQFAAHSLKGSASNVCAEPTRQAAQQIEHMGQQSKCEEARPLLGELQDHLVYLQEFAASLKHG
ncbi:MAG: response regulator [Phycisphaerales bacterium]|nr:MAG: response regulator [Phycisphaerales bacterium]